jgi:radical SAM superfamily enzyme YgiQ (UPF0313 family)
MNLAIRILYELNHEQHPELEFKEFTIKEKALDIAEYCSNYEVVAFSCYIWNITQTLQVCEKLKQINPHIIIVLGGPEVSYEIEDILRRNPIDYIITGEGEIPFKQFLNHFPNVSHIPNLAYIKDGILIHKQEQVTFDLNELKDKNPYRHDPPEDLYNKICYIETSRGCPYKCEFCLASLDNKVRYLPIDTIKNNLLYVMQHGRVIKFLDRTFNVKRDFTIDMFDFILAHHKPHQVFQFEITADIVHPDIIAYVNQHVPPGLLRFEIGIQTVNKEANLQVSRKQNFTKTAGVIKQLDHVIEMHLDLIVGLPLDYFEDIKYSIEQVFALYPSELQLGFLKFLKGTPVRIKHESHEYVFDPSPPYQIIRSKYLNEQELQHITWVEEALEIYWNKKRALNVLRYVNEHYSIFDFLFGVGQYFQSIIPFYKHTLTQAYDILIGYIKLHHPNDQVLLELAVVDYYMHHKIKPQVKYIDEVEINLNKKIKSILPASSQKVRQICFPISFDMNILLSTHTIQQHKGYMVLQYNGTDKPQLFYVEQARFTVAESVVNQIT